MSKSPIEQAIDSLTNPDGTFIDSLRCKCSDKHHWDDWYMCSICQSLEQIALAGAQKLAELLKRRTEIVEGEIYTEEVIPLSALKEIMGTKV